MTTLGGKSGLYRDRVCASARARAYAGKMGGVWIVALAFAAAALADSGARAPSLSDATTTPQLLTIVHPGSRSPIACRKIQRVRDVAVYQFNGRPASTPRFDLEHGVVQWDEGVTFSGRFFNANKRTSYLVAAWCEYRKVYR
jgi:hypothetical protein